MVLNTLLGLLATTVIRACLQQRFITLNALDLRRVVVSHKDLSARVAAEDECTRPLESLVVQKFLEVFLGARGVEHSVEGNGALSVVYS